MDMSKTELDVFLGHLDMLQKSSWLQAHSNWRVLRHSLHEFQEKRRLMLVVEVSSEDFETHGVKFSELTPEQVDEFMGIFENEFQEEHFGRVFYDSLRESGLLKKEV